MKPITIVGVVLILGGITYTKNETVLDVGPLKMEAETKESIPIPQIAAILAAIAGVGLVIAGRRT
jgi:hypothetical protein